MTGLVLEWRRWSLVDEGRAGWLKGGLVTILAAVLWVVLVLSLPLLVAVVLNLGFLVLVLPYFLPVFYQVDETGISIRSGWGISRRRSWQSFEGWEIVPGGYRLLPGLFLPLPSDEAARSILASMLVKYLSENSA